MSDVVKCYFGRAFLKYGKVVGSNPAGFNNERVAQFKNTIRFFPHQKILKGAVNNRYFVAIAGSNPALIKFRKAIVAFSSFKKISSVVCKRYFVVLCVVGSNPTCIQVQ
jgi:hypothetical protein